MRPQSRCPLEGNGSDPYEGYHRSVARGLSICDGDPDRLAYPANFRIASMTAAGCSSGMKWPESGIA